MEPGAGDLGTLSSSSYNTAFQPPSSTRVSSRVTSSLPPASSPTLQRINTAVTPSTSSRTASPRVSPLPLTGLEQDVLQKLQRWIVCFAVVEFDLDTGPMLDTTYPTTSFSPSLSANIAFSSLPEGDLPTAGAHSYSWRIPLPRGETLDKGVAEEEEGDGCLHGFVYFQTEKNEALRRGYLQRSLVLITRHPSLVGLFSSTLSILGPLHFKHPGGGMVEAACHNIAAWPDLVPGTFDLPFLGTVQSVEIPLGNQPQWPPPPARLTKASGGSPSIGAIRNIPASLPLTPLSVFFHSSTLSFTRIILLWELILLGESILIYTADPRTGAELVHHLRNLIRPIIMGGDYRPYFHVHDVDFQRIAAAPKPPPGALLASTNPLVLSSCKSWPHLLRTHVGKTDDKNVAAGLTSTRKRHIKKDPKASKEVEDAFKRGDYLASDALLLRHLTTLTEQFLSPLNRYCSTFSTPPPFSPMSPTLSPPLPTPPAPTFTPSAFLSSLKSHGTPLPFRGLDPSGSAQRFYERFLKSGNFFGWLEGRTKEVGKERRRAYLGMLEKGDVEGWFIGGGGGRGDVGERRFGIEDGMGGRGEEEVQELVERLEREATISEATPSEPATRGARLRGQAARLRTLRDERRSSGSGVESESGAASVRSVGLGVGLRE